MISFSIPYIGLFNDWCGCYEIENFRVTHTVTQTLYG